MMKKKSILVYTFLIVLTSVYFFPIYWMLITSFRDLGLSYSPTVSILPLPFTLDNYRYVLDEVGILNIWKNTIYMASISTLICVFLAVLSGYSLSRFAFRGRNLYGLWLYITQLLPPILVMIPLYVILTQLHFNNTLEGLIVASAANTLPFSIWMMKGYFDSIPQDLEEAALVDGCSRFGSIFRIVAPVSLPGIVTVVIFSFLGAYQNYLIPTMLIHSENLFVITLGVNKVTSWEWTYWGPMMAYGAFSTLPLIPFFAIMQRYIVKGLTLGAVKG